MNDFKEKFNIEQLTIKKVGSWIISLRPAQVTLGSLILSLDRACEDIGDLTSKESQELGLAFQVIKDLYMKSFRPDKVNYLLLMMVDKQVHFHVIPRYEKKISFQAIEFEDAFWPKPVDILSSLAIEESLLLEIKDHLQHVVI